MKQVHGLPEQTRRITLRLDPAGRAPSTAHALVILLSILLTLGAQAQQALPSYQEWRQTCQALPTNRELKGKLPEGRVPALPTFADFEAALDGFLEVTRSGPLGNEHTWIGERPDPTAFFDTTRSWFGSKEVPFQPFAAKLGLPTDATVLVMGDLHGDVRSLMHVLDELNARGILDGFTLRDPTCWFLFLGDFTDRGMYGVEVLYTLFRLKMTNPERVQLGRGNHEDFNIVSRYGFLEEIRGKYGEQANITKVMRAYDRMPVVMYVGTATDVLQMNHGGMEPGYDPRGLLESEGSQRFQLLGDLRQRAYHAARPGWLGEDAGVLVTAEKHLADFTPESPTKPRVIGFLWNDFTVFGDEPELGYNRSLVFGAGPTRRVLKDASTERVRVRGVFRAHQHSGSLNPLMSRLVASDGAFRHWQETESSADAGKKVKEIRDGLRPEETRAVPDGSVWTFNVSPDSVYGAGCGYDFATVGILTLAREFEAWRVRVVRVEVF
ncbi:MAG: metallophosphoesterase [Phycisphaeraceae bacterium]|nr:metallophosphoesterase [Phycisphaeraceae bacterium]